MGYLHYSDIEPIYVRDLDKYALKVDLCLVGPYHKTDVISSYEEIRLYHGTQWVTYSFEIVDCYQLEDLYEAIDLE